MESPTADDLLLTLLPEARRWVETVFPAPIPVVGKKQSDIASHPALYLYLQKFPGTIWGGSHSFTGLRLGGSEWTVLYVGQAAKMSNRHNQHIDKVETCRKYALSELIPNGMSVSDIDLSSQAVLLKFQSRREHFLTDKSNDRNCKMSIGWSLATHLTHIECRQPDYRLRLEKALTGILWPPLNR